MAEDEESCEADRVVKRLPRRPELYMHLFKPFTAKDDAFLAEVLTKACEEGLVWRWNTEEWNNVCGALLTRGFDVFKAWVEVRYVVKVVERVVGNEGATTSKVKLEWPTRTLGEMIKDKELSVQLSNPKREWHTLAHALGHLKLLDLLDHLLERFPELELGKVSASFGSSSCSCKELLLI